MAQHWSVSGQTLDFRKMQQHTIIKITTWLTTMLTLLLLTGTARANSLIVFVDRTQKIDQHFISEYLPQVKEIAEKYSL